MTSISNFLRRSAGPYDEVVKGKVVGSLPLKPTGQDGERKLLTVAVADGDSVVKVNIFDNTKFVKFTEGNSVSMRNILKRSDNTLVVTKLSKVYLTSGISVSEELVAAGHKLLNPPPADFVSLRNGLESPQKTVVSIKGEIVQEDKERDVLVNKTPTKVKDIYIKDETVQKVKVTLWREKGEADIRPGSYVSITNVITSTYKGEISFSTTAGSDVVPVEAPLLERLVTIEGICVEEEVAELLCVNGEVVKVAVHVLAAVASDEEDIEQFVCKRLPQQFKILARGATVDRVELA